MSEKHNYPEFVNLSHIIFWIHISIYLCRRLEQGANTSLGSIHMLNKLLCSSYWFSLSFTDSFFIQLQWKPRHSLFLPVKLKFDFPVGVFYLASCRFPLPEGKFCPRMKSDIHSGNKWWTAWNKNNKIY